LTDFTVLIYKLVTSPAQFHSHVLGDKANHPLRTQVTSYTRAIAAG